MTAARSRSLERERARELEGSGCAKRFWTRQRQGRTATERRTTPRSLLSFASTLAPDSRRAQGSRPAGAESLALIVRVRGGGVAGRRLESTSATTDDRRVRPHAH